MKVASTAWILAGGAHHTGFSLALTAQHLEDYADMVSVDGPSKRVESILVHHNRIDQDHSNGNTVWKQMGSPQHQSSDQYTRLESAGQLQLLESPRWMNAHATTAELDFSLPSRAISLVELHW